MKELASALAKAQGGFKHIARDKTVTVRTKTGGTYSFSYAPLESIMGAIKEALTSNGIALLQDIREGKVVTILLHSSGEQWVSGGTVINVSEQGAQAYGSGLTYARRYDLTLTLGLCADDDDDGNAADGNQASPRPAELKNLKEPITPTTGAWDNVPKERHEPLRRIGNGVIDQFSNGTPEAALDYLDELGLDNEEKICIWTMLDSKMRATLKKLGDERRKNPKLTEQA